MAKSKSRNTKTKKEAPQDTGKKKRKSGATISMKTYRAIRDDYIQHQSIRHAAKVAGVRFETAKKYIVEGRPEKNMPSIEKLVRAESNRETAQIEYSLQTFRKKYIKELQEALDGSLLEIRLHNEKTKKLKEMVSAEKMKGEKGKIVEPSSPFVHQIKAHDMIVRLMERALGGADETVEISQSDFVKQMTAEECLNYIKTAEIPKRLR